MRRGREPWRKWYKLAAWQQRRADQLAKQPLCERHLARGEIVAATVANHKVPHRGDWDLFIGGELESSCKACHDSVIQQEEVLGYSPQIGTDGWPVDARHPFNSGVGLKDYGYSIPNGVRPSGIPVTLVCGPPAAGKTTHVKHHAAPGDVIIDFDAIRCAVGGQVWDQDAGVNTRAFAYRDKIIMGLSARHRGRAWLIVMAPTLDERRAWCAALGDVTVVVLMPTKDECISRVRADPSRAAKAILQSREIERWFLASDAHPTP